MRINRVVVENFGLYCGRMVFDVVPRAKRQVHCPIILIGGMNGAGKSTLLDGVRLALYGKNAVGEHLSEKKYQEYLHGMIHRSRDAVIQFDYARVGVEFDFVFRGDRQTYYVQRSWSGKNGGVQEYLQVYRRDEGSTDGDYNSWPTLPDVDPKHWQSFVDDVVPERLSQLFFFDGEKIKRIADDISGDAAVAESIRSLLGLDLVTRLKADLSILAGREAKRFSTSTEFEEMDSLEKEIDELKNKLVSLRGTDRPQRETAIRGIEAEIKRIEERLNSEGGAFATNRQAKRERESALHAHLDSLYKQIRLECEGLFPLALSPTVAQWLHKHMNDDVLMRRAMVLEREFRSLEQDLIIDLSRSIPGGETTDEVIKIVRQTIGKRLPDTRRHANSESILGLSEMDCLRISGWLEQANESAAKTMRRLCVEVEKTERELQDTRRQLEKEPEQIVLQPIFEEINAQHRLLGQRQAELSEVDQKIKQLETTLSIKERELDRLRCGVQERASSEARIVLIGSVQSALDKYLSRLTKIKVETLCVAVSECFKQLSRKGDQLHEISINPQTFEIKLKDKAGYIIPRGELSAGEKQMLAIAILWGLARTSGRPLPIIIDTPLGRLDSNHRINLVRNYFPRAGHQVILLSTDTEVDQRLFQELHPYVSHCYHLVYDQAKWRTQAREEYFWKEPSDA